MQAAHHTAPKSSNTEKDPYDDQFAYLRVAIWMVEFRNRYATAGLTPGRYDTIIRKFRTSLQNAEKAHNRGETWSVPGGTALRIAKAIWSLEYRLLIPLDHQRILKEERDASHLYHYHRDVKKAKKNHVWAAMEEYFTLRISLLGGIPVPANKKEDIFRPNPFTKALRMLDTFVMKHSRLRNREIFKDIFPAIASADPAHKALLVPFCEAAHAWGQWELTPRNPVSQKQRTVAYEALLKAQYDNAEYLQSAGMPLNKAINLLLYEMRLPLS